MSQPFKLYRLQQIDTQLDRSQQRLQNIETALSEDVAVRQAKQQLEEAAQKLDAARKALRQAELHVQDQRVKIEQTEATLYSGKVRNPKEMQDMQQEAEALKRYRSVLEDRQLDAMISAEEAEAEHQQASREFETASAEAAQRNSKLFEEQAALLKDVAHSEMERQAAASSIPVEDLDLYEQLRKQRRGLAVAKVTDKACTACGTTLNAALLSAARNPNILTRCDHCGRILYAL